MSVILPVAPETRASIVTQPGTDHCCLVRTMTLSTASAGVCHNMDELCLCLAAFRCVHVDVRVFLFEGGEGVGVVMSAQSGSPFY